MKKQNTQYSTFTSYLAKTNKNVDMYRIYNPLNENLRFNSKRDKNFYDLYFKRHFITRRNILTVFSIHCYLTKNERFISDRVSFVKCSIYLFRIMFNSLANDIDFNISFRGGNLIFISQFGKKEEISYFTFSKIAGDIFDIKDFSMSNEKLLAA
ncbi:hypothetical protein OQN31_23865 [Citrobacter freundii]|uniref:Uncharacterized protein n=1 Tax=Klebsiella pneumoniae TaxID=573 RepID=A0A486V7U7_KLEPN|nr:MULTISPECIES: hypothetical protein [Enterobacteriaceae]EBU9868320.1 hypothetical protein [Salmonella enterica subsp. enterica serovar Braenderup]ECC1580916.1 hypothetical protein [Salmonella enterica subsp. diarizonae]EEM1700911.1 hypothetical protein [Salmonella enterica]ELB6488087.1 hypothetical protein [Raoultella ornithinolytica]HAS1014361.1 hypothetical protein [Enterobacter roggenkampii]